jgi:hypothetical protein
LGYVHSGRHGIGVGFGVMERVHADVVTLDLDDAMDDGLTSSKDLWVVMLSRNNNMAPYHLW